MNIANSALYLRNRLRDHILKDRCELPADKTFYRVSYADLHDMMQFLEDLILVDVEIKTGREGKMYREIEGAELKPEPPARYER